MPGSMPLLRQAFKRLKPGLPEWHIRVIFAKFIQRDDLGGCWDFKYPGRKSKKYAISGRRSAADCVSIGLREQ